MIHALETFQIIHASMERALLIHEKLSRFDVSEGVRALLNAAA